VFLLDPQVKNYDEIKTELDLVDPKVSVVTVSIKQNIPPETEKERMRYDRAQKTRMRGTGGEWRITTNFAVLSQLYEEAITTPTGLAFEGKPLLDRTVWIPRIPEFLKVMVTHERFRVTRLKNV